MARNINSTKSRKNKAQPLSPMVRNTLTVIYGPNWTKMNDAALLKAIREIEQMPVATFKRGR